MVLLEGRRMLQERGNDQHCHIQEKNLCPPNQTPRVLGDCCYFTLWCARTRLCNWWRLQEHIFKISASVLVSNMKRMESPLIVGLYLCHLCSCLSKHTLWKMCEGGWVIINLSAPGRCARKEGGGNHKQQEKRGLLLSKHPHPPHESDMCGRHRVLHVRNDSRLFRISD